jgi:predicted RNase H-like HicB family nuclease
LKKTFAHKAFDKGREFNNFRAVLKYLSEVYINMLAHFTAIYEKGDKYYIGYCPEVPGANGQGETLEECRESLKEAIKLILEDRLEDALRGIPDDAIQEMVFVE